MKYFKYHLKHKIKILNIVCFVLLIVLNNISCNKNSVIKVDPFLVNEIADHQLKLISINNVCDYSFNNDGSVSTTFGKKDYQAGAIFQWVIDSYGSLVVFHDEEKFSIIKKIRIESNILYALENNTIIEFAYK